METIIQESKKNKSWVWLILGIIVLLAVFLWVRNADVSQDSNMKNKEKMGNLDNPVVIVSEESTEILDVELQALDFADLDADLAELEEIE